MPPHFLQAIAGQSFDFIVRSPGRINIIGEHIDYNGGLVLPAAIDKAIYFAVRRRADQLLVLHALDINERATVQLPQNTKTGNLWVDYLLGIAEQYRLQGHQIPGLDIVFGGNLPRGAGVSSSAAMEGGMAFISNKITKAGFSRSELAQICHQSSNVFLGIPSGIMDQFASLNGKADHAILLDCNSLEHEFIPAQLPGYKLLLVNSLVTHQLGDSEYPVRVKECQEGLAALQVLFPELKTLAEATPKQVEAIRPQVSDTIYRRCHYVSQESIRIQRAVVALRAGDALSLGEEMNATHAGLRDDYEVSCAEIDFLQAFAQAYPDVAGSRIMGGGFGGCTINLIKEAAIPAFKTAIATAYRTAENIEPGFYEVHIQDGTQLVGNEGVDV
ncbi:MAG: galactokinase [Bacteroidota bacterium]